MTICKNLFKIVHNLQSITIVENIVKYIIRFPNYKCILELLQDDDFVDSFFFNFYYIEGKGIEIQLNLLAMFSFVFYGFRKYIGNKTLLLIY